MQIFDTTPKKVDSDKESVRRTLRKKCPYSRLFWSVFPRITLNTDTFYAVVRKTEIKDIKATEL